MEQLQKPWFSMVDDGSHCASTPLFNVDHHPMATPNPIPDQEPERIAALIQALQEDRRWLLRHLDEGHWSAFRLDLAALERELGQLLEFCEARTESV